MHVTPSPPKTIARAIPIAGSPGRLSRNCSAEMEAQQPSCTTRFDLSDSFIKAASVILSDGVWEEVLLYGGKWLVGEWERA